MNVELTGLQARIIGVMYEKSITQPDLYPMTLNSITVGCNQKSNRHPVMDLSDKDVHAGMDQLREKGLLISVLPSGSRTMKYKLKLEDFFIFSPQEIAILCLLLLRGPQTPGELRTRSTRLCTFHDLSEVLEVLNELRMREDGPFVRELDRQPGMREARYIELFRSPSEAHLSPEEHAPEVPNTLESAWVERLNRLEQKIMALEQRIDSLMEQPSPQEEMPPVVPEPVSEPDAARAWPPQIANPPPEE